MAVHLVEDCQHRMLDQHKGRPRTARPAWVSRLVTSGELGSVKTSTIITVLLLAVFLTGLFAIPSRADARGQVPCSGYNAPCRVPHAAGWMRVADCESSFRWRLNGTFDGGLQFSPTTWRSVDTKHRYSYAYQAPPWFQVAMAEKLRKRDGIGQWPHCGSKF